MLFIFVSGRFLGVVFRVSRDVFVWLPGASWGLPGGLPDVIFGRISGIPLFCFFYAAPGHQNGPPKAPRNHKKQHKFDYVLRRFSKEF